MEEYSIYVEGQQSVDLEQQDIGDEKLAIILAQPTQHIVQFKLRKNNLTKESALHIQRASWNNLETLYLTNNRIADKGCKYLSQTSLPLVKKMGLRNNQITSVGSFHLSKGVWKTLEQLYLFENKMCVDPVRCLTKANWPSLKEISIQQNLYPSYEKNSFNLIRFSLTGINGIIDDTRLEQLIKEKFQVAQLVIDHWF